MHKNALAYLALSPAKRTRSASASNIRLQTQERLAQLGLQDCKRTYLARSLARRDLSVPAEGGFEASRSARNVSEGSYAPISGSAMTYMDMTRAQTAIAYIWHW